MRIEFIIHGNPNGFECFSTNKSDELYAQTFWSTTIFDDASMIVETKVLNNSICCYYTYYRTNILSATGRTGSYLAITLKTDVFISNLRLLYQILDIIYYRHVYGSLITVGKVRRYTEPSFEKHGKQIEDGLVKLLTSYIPTSCITRLDDTFIANAGPAQTLHPFDLDGFDLTQYKKAEKLIVSPNAQTPRERERVAEFQKKIEFVRIDAERRLKDVIDKERCMHDKVTYLEHKLHTEIMTRQEERKKCTDEKQKLSEQIHRLEQQNKMLMVERSRVEAQKELQSTLAALSTPLSKVVNALSRMGMPMNARPIPERNFPDEKKTKTYIPLLKFGLTIFNAIATIIIIGLLIFLLINNRNEFHKAEIGVASENILSDNTSCMISENSANEETAQLNTHNIIVGEDDYNNKGNSPHIISTKQEKSQKGTIKEKYDKRNN